MALPNGTQISYDQIHVEAGGASGTQCSLENTDIRALIGEAAGDQHGIDEWWGASAESIGVDWETGSTYTWKDTSTDHSYAQVILGIDNDGTFYRRYEASGAQSYTHYNWNTSAPGTTGSNYKIKWVVNSGVNFNSGNMANSNTWYDLGTNRYCSVSDTTVGGTNPTANVTFTIAKTDGSDPAEQTFAFEAELLSSEYITWPTSLYTISSFGVAGEPCEKVGFRLEPDGDTDRTDSNGIFQADNASDWLSDAPKTPDNTYEVKWVKTNALTQTPSYTFGVAENTWIQISSNRDFYFSAASLTRSFEGNITIRKLNDASSEVVRPIVLSQAYEP